MQCILSTTRSLTLLVALCFFCLVPLSVAMAESDLSVRSVGTLNRPYVRGILPSRLDKSQWINSLGTIAKRHPGLVAMAMDENAILDPLVPVAANGILLLVSIEVRDPAALDNKKPIQVSHVELSDAKLDGELKHLWKSNGLLENAQGDLTWWIDASGKTAAATGLLSTAGARAWRALAVDDGVVAAVAGPLPVPDNVEQLLRSVHPSAPLDIALLTVRDRNGMFAANREALSALRAKAGQDSTAQTSAVIAETLYDQIVLSQPDTPRAVAKIVLGPYSTEKLQEVWLKRVSLDPESIGPLSRHRLAMVTSFQFDEQRGATLALNYGSADEVRQACETFQLRFTTLFSSAFKKPFREVWPAGVECHESFDPEDSGANWAVLIFWDGHDGDDSGGVESDSYRALYKMLEARDILWLYVTK